MPIRWLEEVGADDVPIAGGKGASLGELVAAQLQVPPGFVVSAETFRSFVESTGIDAELYELLDTDAEDADELTDVSRRARGLITDTAVPPETAEEIRSAYGELADASGDDAVPVAVRSSATAEDLPDSSFAGQQDTYLNVVGEDLVERVRDCWASLFTSRAIYYRQTRGFDHESVDIAVVVQRMVDAEKSGVLFTRDPSTGAAEITVEAAWGLGEGVVSGAVSPDTYVLERDGSPIHTTVATKKTMFVRDPETGETVEVDVPDDRRDEQVLSTAELDELVALAGRVEDHYGVPQDVEWAIADGEVYLLQSRPITTIDEGAADAAAEEADAGDGAGAGSVATAADGDGTASATTADDDGSGGVTETLVSGLAASPGRHVGTARVVTHLDQLDKVGEGDIIVAEMTTPDMVPAMQRAGGIVTDEGGLTSHAAIVSRELGLPAVTGTGEASRVLEDGQRVAIDGERGTISAAPASAGDDDGDASGTDADAGATAAGGAGDGAATTAAPAPMTATEVKVNVSLASAAERAAATGADGVGLLRTEHMILETGKTPAKYVEDHGADAYVDQLVGGMQTVADAFYPRPVRVRTLDAPTDEFRRLEGGESEPEEANPMLGYRGIRRSLNEPATFDYELRAFRRLYELGYDNVEVMFPLVADGEDVERCAERLAEAGVDTERRDWGAMVETPAAALAIGEIVDAGVDFVSFGTNDLTQYTLAVDRNNERVADRYDAEHPAVKRLIADVIETCRANDVETSICGEAGSQPGMVEFLVQEGVSSISANIDAVADVQRLAKRVEQRILLDSVR